MRNRFFLVCTAIVLTAFCLRVYRLSTPPTFYFDEIYHAYTATTYLHNDPKGYEYWQTPPKDVAYEWTHPPLAKLLMAGGMLLFGENSFGWRISSVLFGTGVIAMIGVLSFQLFRNKKLTVFALILAASDGLLLSMSRIAMNDMHFLFFALVSVYFYIRFRRKLFSSIPPFSDAVYAIIFISLALASKWTALYVGAALGLDTLIALLWNGKIPFKTIIFSFCAAIVLVPIVYLGSYGQFFLQGHTFTQWRETTQQMWWYHTNLKATHPFQSRPLQWLTDMRPVWMEVDYSQNDQGIIGNIYNAGNPLVFWTGLLVIGTLAITHGQQLLHAASSWLVGPKKKFTLAWEVNFLLLCYVTLWAPWLFSPRIMFFYHYAPAVPFLCILTAYGLDQVWKQGKRGELAVKTLLAAIVIVGIVLFPLNTSYPMPQSYFDTIFSIFPTWK